MPITTKTGDDGKSRFAGKVVNKDSELLEVIGTLDEAQGWMALASTSLRDPKGRGNLNGRDVKIASLSLAMTKCMEDLYWIMGIVAGYPAGEWTANERVKYLESEIEKLEKELLPKNKFIIFKSEAGAKMNMARVVVRRAERRLAALNKIQSIDPNILIYINRLSDYLFLMARQFEEQY